MENMKGHIFSGLVLACLLLALVGCGGSTSTATPTSTGPQTIKIPMGDFYIRAPQTTYTTGVQYSFVVTNNGKYGHDFFIMHPESTGSMTMDQVNQQALAYIANIAPGQSKTLNFVFDHTAAAGVLEFSDRYSGQYEAGMHQSIVVNAPSGSSVTPYPNNGIPAVATSTTNTAAKCDAPVTVKIAANDIYTPQSVTINKGDTLVFNNPTSQSFTLTTQPDASIPFTVVDPGETQPTPFPQSGTFTVSSKEHPNDSLTVHVSSTPGVTCGYTPVATISFDASYSNTAASYFFAPSTVTIKEGQSIILSNLTDQNKMTYTSKPDADLGNIVLDANENQLLLFSDDGTYTITCAQFPQKSFKIVVLDSGDGN